VGRRRRGPGRGFRRIGVGRGMEALVGRRELGNGRGWERSLAGEGIAVVVGSLVGEEEEHNLAVGVGEGCLRSLVREGRVSARERERSWVEEDREIGFLEERSWADLRSHVEGNDHPEVGYRRSNRYLTL
jgi:hypothetical protein